MEINWLLREKYGGRLTTRAKSDIARLKRGEHVNYVIGWSPFLGCRIDLSARPLIPRPETEYWTEKAIEMIKVAGTKSRGGKARGEKSDLRVLDLFCGSGCIGIAVLKHIPKARVDFADIEKKYFTGIRKSQRVNGINAGRAGYISSDVFENIGGAKKYDFILANPPYVPTSGRAVAKSVLRQEPKRALFAGKDGLRYIRKMLREAEEHLRPSGALIVEFDPPQKRAISAYAKKQGWNTKFFKDQYERWRFVTAVRQDA